MKYIILLTIASVAAAAKLDKVYLPPNSASAGGADAGLQTPFESSQNYEAQNQANHGQNYPALVQNYANQNLQGQNYAQSHSYSTNQAEILRFENEMNEQGYHYAYETSDGTKAEQDGQILPGTVPEEGSLKISGSYSYIGDDGQTYSVSYIADENGFQPIGDHLPTPPPIPEAILRSLQLTDREGKYNSQKSSYDADAGY
ncbi:unnamed protein product [Leptosia nina]|uniref:Uncharacterized protein n=1 Tax=Leptosia nina TaxID=320188 RepID=A0AAV1JMS5_9NEOP